MLLVWALSISMLRSSMNIVCVQMKLVQRDKWKHLKTFQNNVLQNIKIILKEVFKIAFERNYFLN